MIDDKKVSPPLTTPDPGFEVCYECDGYRVCWACGGEGKMLDGSRCHTCAGRGSCIVCNGAGQLPLGTAASAGADKHAVTEHPGRLILVGNFREMGYDDQPEAPSLHDVRRKRSLGHKPEVLAYLRKAKSISFSPGYETSIFDQKTFVGTHTMRTDGVYVWPDFLAGYVEHEDVALPEQFERHMAARNWQLPENLDTKKLTPPW